MNQKDKHRERSGMSFFRLTGTVVSAAVPALFAVAGFFFYIPYLNLASAVLFTPLVCALLYKLLFMRTRMGVPSARVATAVVSALGAYVHVCVLTGVLSGIFGAWPVGTAVMAETELMEYIKGAGTIFGDAAHYFLTPGLLWQDLAARGEAGWAMIAAGGVIAQIGIPQLFIRRRPEPLTEE
ncbi:MAG: hypothetical protein LBH95_09215 [Oscillospiraceae bacterium]|jgi:hypothetical protein|nr:hypothetical protein [Oscillospiraceae bacterium]